VRVKPHFPTGIVGSGSYHSHHVVRCCAVGVERVRSPGTDSARYSLGCCSVAAGVHLQQKQEQGRSRISPVRARKSSGTPGSSGGAQRRTARFYGGARLAACAEAEPSGSKQARCSRQDFALARPTHSRLGTKRIVVADWRFHQADRQCAERLRPAPAVPDPPA
jgi:hypothetical protein